MQKVVETSDFRKTLEEVSGRSLVRFFEQWFYTPSFPQLWGDWEYDEETKVVTLTICQGKPPTHIYQQRQRSSSTHPPTYPRQKGRR